MTAPIVWEEAAHLAAERLQPLAVGCTSDIARWLDSDMKNLRRVFAGELKTKPTVYARSMARRALHELSKDTVSFYERRGEILTLIARKQHDYGHGNILAFGVNGIIVRLSDKVERYKNLLGRDLVQGLDESIEDTLVDIVGYAIILTMLENGTFELPLRADVILAEDAGKTLEFATSPATNVTLPDIFVVSIEDVRRIVREELKAYDKAQLPFPFDGNTWSRYAKSAFGGNDSPPKCATSAVTPG